MKKEVFNEIKDKLTQRKLIDEYLLCKYIYEIISMEDIEDYISNASITHNKDSLYNMSTLDLSICIDDILYKRENEKIPDSQDMISKTQMRTKRVRDINNINIYNIISVHHEISHAMQNSLFDLTPYEFEELDDFSKWRLALIEKNMQIGFASNRIYNGFYYDEYHDYFFGEYDADINAYLQTLRFFELLDVKEINKNIQVLNALIARQILYLYRDINNMKKRSSFNLNFLYLYNLIMKIAKEKGIEVPHEDYSVYRGIPKPEDQLDRLRLGFSLSKDTYEYLDMVAKNRHKTLNLFDDIKNI